MTVFANSSDWPGLFMKTHKNLYDKLCSYENLYDAFRKARKGKGSREYVKEFESRLESNLMQLKRELETLTYVPKPLKTFVIRDPKTRVIAASCFRDRIVHHALCNIIEPMFDRTFIHDSYASRKGKGTHRAIERFDRFKRKVTQNGRRLDNARDSNMVVGYVLKADIRHYFASVDHRVMMATIRKRIGDRKVLWLTGRILANHNPRTPNKGMPIGNLTSQIFANIYLNGFDCFVKHELKARHYIRYLDDFVIFDRSMERLIEYKENIKRFLKTIRLELHPEKSNIIPLHKGINFLGFRVFYHHKLLKKKQHEAVQKEDV